jgi:predicted DNA-binding transcriptional regulator AlpA
VNKHNQTSGGSSSSYLPAKAVCKRYGVTSRTLDRWLADSAMEFPRPMVVNNRRYFSEEELTQWERARAVSVA